jgi:hypothetical protein
MAVAVVAGLASTAGAYGTAVALGTVASFGLTAGLTAFAIGAGLSMISQALQPNLRVGQDTGLSTSVANPIAERPIIYGRTRTGGTIVYFTTSGADNKYLHLVIAVAGHAIDGYEKVYFDDQVIWEDGSYVDDWVQNAQINFYDGTQTTADQDLINASNEWNSNCILNDTAYIHVRLEYDPEVYTNGIPSITTTIRGKKVLDPRTDVTAWSENPALCIYDYLKDPKYGLNDNTVNEAQVIASANVCDQLVTIDTGVDQTRYALSGFISTGDTIKANLEKMLSSMFGKLVCSGGELFVNAGYYTSPVLDIDESLLVGAVSLQTKTSRRNVYNAVKGTFLSEEENYIFADYPSIKSDTYSTEDGEPLYLDLPLPCTTNNVRAQRLAKLSLNKSRQQRSLSIPVNLAGLKVRAGDVIRFTSERLGISNAEYEVIDFEFEYSDQLIVNLVCVETGSSLYDWTVADKLDFSVGSDITLYDGTAIAPTGLTATAVSNILSDGTDSTYIDVAWTNPSDIYFDYVVLKYGDQSIVTKDQTYRINNVDENTEYTITISAYNTFGRQSTGLSTNVTTVRDTTAPANITSITATGGLQTIDLSWTNPTDDDFDLVRIKVASTNSEPTGYSYEVRADNFIDDVGAYSATRYYWLAPVDRTGNVGNYVSGGSATTGSITINDVPQVAGTFYLTLGDNDAPTNTEFNTAVGRDPINGDFVIVNKEFAFNYDGSVWTAVTEFIDGSLLVSGSISADDITTGTLNANDVTISNLTVTSGQLPSDVVYDGDLGASGTTVIDGGRISAGTAVTVGTGDNVAVLSGADATYRLWAGDASSADAPFKVSQTGVLYATGAEISGNITAGSIDAENITFTGSLIADGLSTIPNVEATNMTQSLRNAIEEIIVTKFGSDASTGYYDEATGSFDAQDDNTEICRINTFQHNGSNIDIDVTFSRSWQASSNDIPSVTVNIQRSVAGANSWTTIKTQTITGSVSYVGELGDYFANIQGVVSITDNPTTGNYDYRFFAGTISNLSLITISARLEANEQGEQIGTIDLADYARIDQDETISGNYTFSGTTSGINYDNLDDAPTISATVERIIDNAWAGVNGHAGYNAPSGNSRFGFSAPSGRVDVYADGNFYATDSAYKVYHTGDFTIADYATKASLSSFADLDGNQSTTTVNQWGRVKNTNTTGYSEFRIENDNNDYTVLGSIGSGYTQADWAGSSYLYSNRTFRLKSTDSLEFYAGGHSNTSRMARFQSTGIDLLLGDYKVNGNTVITASRNATFASATASTLNATNLNDEAGLGFRASFECISGEGWATTHYAYNNNDGFLFCNRISTGGEARPVFHIGGYNNAGFGGYSAEDTIVTITRANGTKLTGSSRADKALSTGNDYFNIVKTSDRTIFNDAQSKYQFNGEVQFTTVKASGADSTPAGTAFSNTVKGVGTNRTIYFDGHSSSVSTWYGVGNDPYTAIDSVSGEFQFWVNPSNGTWYHVHTTNTSGINLKLGSYQVNGSTVIDASRNASFANITHTGAQYWNGHIYWGASKNIYVQSGECSFDVSTSAQWRVWDATNSIDAIKVTGGSQVEIGQAGSRGLKVYGTVNCGGLSTTGEVIHTRSTNNYVRIESTGTKEAMIRYNTDFSNYWYTGTRTSAGLGSTADHHIYSSAAGSDIACFKTDGYLNIKNGYQVNSTTVIDASRNALNLNSIQFPSSSGKVAMSLYDGALHVRSFSDKYHKIWYYDGIAFGTNSSHGHFRFYAETNTQRNASSGGAYLRFDIDSVTGNCTASGNITAYSDIKLKENINTIESPLDKVTSLRGVTYNRKDQDDGRLHMGVIAQEVEKVIPEVVDYQEETDTKTVSYGNMVGLLIEAIKELKQEIEELKNGNHAN